MISLDLAKSIFQVHGIDASGNDVICNGPRAGTHEGIHSTARM